MHTETVIFSIVQKNTSVQPTPRILPVEETILASLLTNLASFQQQRNGSNAVLRARTCDTFRQSSRTCWMIIEYVNIWCSNAESRILPPCSPPCKFAGYNCCILQCYSMPRNCDRYDPHGASEYLSFFPSLQRIVVRELVLLFTCTFSFFRLTCLPRPLFARVYSCRGRVAILLRSSRTFTRERNEISMSTVQHCISLHIAR